MKNDHESELKFEEYENKRDNNLPQGVLAQLDQIKPRQRAKIKHVCLVTITKWI